MEHFKKELLIARVTSGTVRLKTSRGVTLLVKKPSRDDIYIACEIYAEVFEEALAEGLHDEASLLCFLVESNLWSEEEQELLDKLPKEIENFKVELFKSTFKANEAKLLRKHLATAKAKHSDLYQKRHGYDHLSCSGAANMAKARYVIGRSLHTVASQPVFPTDDFWNESSPLLEQAMTAYAASHIPEGEFRAVARTEPWLSTWTIRKAGKTLFDCAVADCTDEQRRLIGWSNIYENIFQHPECPADSMFDDDDMIDGWMINQQRERTKKTESLLVDSVLGNEKIRSSGEIFVVADTMEDARKVVNMNDPYALSVQQRRLNALEKKGTLDEEQMPDTKQKIQMERQSAFAAHLRGK